MHKIVGKKFSGQLKTASIGTTYNRRTIVFYEDMEPEPEVKPPTEPEVKTPPEPEVDKLTEQLDQVTVADKEKPKRLSDRARRKLKPKRPDQALYVARPASQKTPSPPPPAPPPPPPQPEVKEEEETWDSIYDENGECLNPAFEKREHALDFTITESYLIELSSQN